jgi:Protein of unknown function (DUF1525)
MTHPTSKAMKAEKPVKVELIAYAPVAFFHCRHCELVWDQAGAARNIHEEQLASSLPEDLKQEYQELSDWVREMVAAFGERISFRVIDAASLEGWWKSLRYRVRKYPTVIVDGEEKIIGSGHLEQATAAIRQRIEVAPLA